jgi:hypothetical protein
LTEVNIKEDTRKAKKMGKENTLGKMEVIIMEIGWTIKYQVMEFMFGQTEDNTRVIGFKIKCMEKVNIHGKMGENMKVSMNTIKNTAAECILGRTEESTTANG